MKTIILSHHEKMLVELCVRTVLCNLLDEDKAAIWEFTATLFNMNNLGDQDHSIEDTNDWFAQLPILRQALLKLQTEEQRALDIKFETENYTLPEETDIELRKKTIEKVLEQSPYIMVKQTSDH